MGGAARLIVRFCEVAHTSARFFRAAAAGLLLISVLFELCVAFQIGGHKFSVGVDDIGAAVASVLAGVACFVAACRTQRATRLGWALLAAAALFWAGGESYWSFLEVGLGRHIPSPSPADVGFLLALPFGCAGVLVFAVAASRRTAGARALVDGVLIAASLLLVSWEAILRNTFANSSLSSIAMVVNLSYPVADIAMITIILVALTRVSSRGRTVIGLLGAGLVAIAIADGGFVYLAAATDYTANALDGGWFAGFLLIGLASLRAESLGAAPAEERVGASARAIAPYAAVLLAAATIAVVVLTEGQLDPVALRIGAAIAGFSIVSQFLVILENRLALRQSRASEIALLESRRSLHQVIDNAPVALFAIDTAGILTLATGHALAGFGTRAADLTGRSVREVLHDSPEFLAGVEGALLGRPAQLVASFEHGDLDVRLLPVFESGRVVSVSGVAIDVTERRLSEQARRESEAKSRFLATMSHELRTPLNSVLGFAELLRGQRRGSLTETQRRYVVNIIAGGQHLLSLINDVLDLSRVASGEIEVVIRRVSVDDAISGAVAKIRPLADRKRLRLAVDEVDNVEALADPLRLQQIVLNLLSNAIKFTPEGGRIEVRTQRTDGAVEVEVSDTGIGIAAENLDRIFEEYSQVDDAYNREQEGTGLGLAVSRRLADLMSATLSVTSRVGQGSVFKLRLPALSIVPTKDPSGGGQGQDGPDREAEEITAEAAQA